MIRTPGPLVEKVAFGLPDGRLATASMHRTQRPSGRRVIVRDQDRRVLFDSDDCYDHGNAVNKFDGWLATLPARNAVAA